MTPRSPDDPGPWLEVEAHYRHHTSGAVAIWVGDVRDLKEVWVWIPDPFIRRPAPAARGKVEIFQIREKWIISKGLEGFVVEAGADGRASGQGDLF